MENDHGLYGIPSIAITLCITVFDGVELRLLEYTWARGYVSRVKRINVAVNLEKVVAPLSISFCLSYGR